MKRRRHLIFPAQTPAVCVLPVVDVAFDALPRPCGEPATTTYKIASVEVPACDRCAAALDALGADQAPKDAADPNARSGGA
jgi:hypothetical protein